MGFTTNSTLYSIEYELTIRAVLSGAKDLILTQPIHVCPWDSQTCMETMKRIEKAARTVKRRETYPSHTRRRDNRDSRVLVE